MESAQPTWTWTGSTSWSSRHPGQFVVVKPSEGAGIGSWDVRAVRHALGAVLRRRLEASHETLVEHERAIHERRTGETAGTGVGSIHDRVATKETGLAGRLHYDAYERRSGLVHVLPAGTTPGAFARAEIEELADIVDQPYEVLETAPADGGGHVRVARLGHVATAAGPVPVRVEKRISVAGDRRNPTLVLEVSLENLGRAPVSGLLAVEWATTMLGGGANPAAYYVLEGERVAHDGVYRHAALASLHSGNDYVGLDVATDGDAHRGLLDRADRNHLELRGRLRARLPGLGARADLAAGPGARRQEVGSRGACRLDQPRPRRGGGALGAGRLRAAVK